MSTIEERRGIASAGVREAPMNGVATRVFLQPIAAPSILGLAGFTGIACVAALAESIGLVAVLGTLAAGSGITAGAFIYGSLGWAKVGGWVFVISAGCAWYMVLAMVTSYAAGRTIFPTGKYKKAANKPGARPMHPIELEWAEPGVRMGQ